MWRENVAGRAKRPIFFSAHEHRTGERDDELDIASAWGNLLMEERITWITLPDDRDTGAPRNGWAGAAWCAFARIASGDVGNGFRPVGVRPDR